jgi:hypothetical protein
VGQNHGSRAGIVLLEPSSLARSLNSSQRYQKRSTFRRPADGIASRAYILGIVTVVAGRPLLVSVAMLMESASSAATKFRRGLARADVEGATEIEIR